MAHYTLPHNDHVHAHLLPLAIMLVASINFIFVINMDVLSAS